MQRRQYLSLLGGGVIAGVLGSGLETVDRLANPNRPDGTYDGPVFSAHEHLTFIPDGETVDWLVDWMDDSRWRGMVAFSTTEQLTLYDDHPSRFRPYNQEPLTRYGVDKVIDHFDIDETNLNLPPYFPPREEDPPDLGEVPSLYEDSLEAHREWDGIGEISLALIHRLEGDTNLSSPDADWLMDLYGIAADHDVTVMLHPPTADQFDYDPAEKPLDNPVVAGLRTAFDENPKTDFLVHGFREDHLAAVNPLLEDHDNWVYDVSGIMFGHPHFWTVPFQPEGEWSDHRDAVADHHDQHGLQEHIDQAFADWEDILTEHPDRVLCGFDAGRQWHFYDEFFDIHERFYRGLLGRLPEADARKIAFVNALRL